MRRSWIISTAFLFCLAALGAENPVSWSIANSPKKPVRAGTSFALHLQAQIQSGWHLYSIDQDSGGPVATEISAAGNPNFQLGAIKGPKPIQLFDPNFNQRVGFYVDKAEFTVPVQVSPSGTAGSQTLPLQIRYQSCNDKMCLPPKTIKVDAPVEVKAGK
ncbi:MAG: protein-disulfide reductase DsbD N-terminal domain-containing protein [Bryobacteraceae bacterium]